jgi:hypothetical protein
MSEACSDLDFAFKPDGRLKIQVLRRLIEVVFLEVCPFNADRTKVENDWHKLVLMLLCAHTRFWKALVEVAGDFYSELADNFADIDLFAVQAKGWIFYCYYHHHFIFVFATNKFPSL